MPIYRLSIIFSIIFSNNWQNSDFATKKAQLKELNVVQQNAKMGQRGTTSSWSEGKKGYLFPHFPVKCEFSFP